MKQVLFPTNFSEDSKLALQYARQLSETIQAQLIVYNSFYLTESPKRTFLASGTRYDETIRKLKSFVQTESSEMLNPIKLMAEEGYAAPNIIENSKKPRIELVVMNRSKSYDFVDHLFGTRVTNISSGAYCPVLILPPHYSSKKINNILIRDNNQILSPSSYKNLFFKLLANDSQNLDFFKINLFKNGNNQFRTAEANKLSIISPKQLSKEKKELKDYISRKSPDLFVLVLEQKGFFSQFLENMITLPLITELNIPVLVLNQNTLEARDYGFRRNPEKAELRA